MYNCITYQNKRRINFCPAELRYSLKGLHWYPVSTALLPKRPYSEDMWNTTIIRWDFLLDLRTFSGVVCKKVAFFCRHQKLEVRFFWSMSFGCGSVFFFQISKLPSSLLHRNYLEGGYFCIKMQWFWYKVVGGGTLQTWKPLACPTWAFPGHHEGEYVQSFCNWLACAEVYGPGCQRTRRNKGGMAQSWKSWCCEVDKEL